MNENILELKKITKTFPGVIALNDVSISFKKGEVHAIVGENGAGKSTLIKIITGAYTPSSGSIVFDGQEYNKLDPIKAGNIGISAVYQETNLVPYLTAAENVFLGQELHNGIFNDSKAISMETKKILDNLGVDIDPDIPVAELKSVQKKVVEIAKVISHKAKLLILDEPTASLENAEITVLFSIINNLKESGVTIIYISHRLEEIFEISDRCTIMRDSKYITTMDTNTINEKDLIKLMVGRKLVGSYPKKDIKIGSTILEVKDMCTSYLHNISFNLKRGEILGFAGLTGSGRTEVLRALFGADKRTGGEILLNGKLTDIKSPKCAIQNGIGLIPEDRKMQGLVLSLPIWENITYGSLKLYSKAGLIDTKKEEQKINELNEFLNIKAPSFKHLVKNLSGGNQQKVVLAKWLATQCDILLFDEPTIGIDVGTKFEIYKIMQKLVESGKALIMVSSDMPELLGMSDRIMVMHEGNITGELNHSDATQELILQMASNGKREVS